MMASPKRRGIIMPLDNLPKGTRVVLKGTKDINDIEGTIIWLVNDGEGNLTEYLALQDNGIVFHVPVDSDIEVVQQ
jgi:hypothetical protein